jgi:ABC-2 type transport system permease protein
MTIATKTHSTPLRSASSASRILAIALMELRIIFRNKTVLTGAVLMPIVMAAYIFYFGAEQMAGPSATAIMGGLTIMIVALLGVYLTATTTLATRRQELFLKRLRSGESSDTVIWLGMLTPIVALVSAQLAIIAVGFGSAGMDAPAQPLVVLGAALGFLALCATAGMLTSIYTPSAASAQITTLPFIFAVIGTFFWTGFDDGFEALSRLTPGGALQNLLMAGWGAEPLDASVAGAAVALLAWVVLPYLFAAKRFRWEKR